MWTFNQRSDERWVRPQRKCPCPSKAPRWEEERGFWRTLRCHRCFHKSCRCEYFCTLDRFASTGNVSEHYKRRAGSVCASHSDLSHFLLNALCLGNTSLRRAPFDLYMLSVSADTHFNLGHSKCTSTQLASQSVDYLYVWTPT